VNESIIKCFSYHLLEGESVRFSTMLFIDLCTYDLNVWIGSSFCTMGYFQRFNEDFYFYYLFCIKSNI
jgi:hypothetical protein